MRKVRLAFFLALLLAPLLLFAQPMKEGRLMRFPDIYGDKIVFTYAGDLWLVSSEGGMARRITSHPGLELFPKFSPDGKWIAFTGQYDGNMNVYLIPAEGGVPKQLTYAPDVGHVSERMGPNHEVIEWFPDGKHILFLSRRNTFNTWFGRLFKVSIDGGLPEQIVLPKGGLTSFSPDGKKIAYNRIFRNFRTWKRYKGGMAQDIWIYDFGKNEIERITKYKGTDTFPMWYKDKIYFASDRGKYERMNIWCYDLSTKRFHQVTHFKEYDVNWPSLGDGRIVFENGGYLYVLDLATEKAKKITVYLPGDFAYARSKWVDGSKFISEFGLAPEGKNAIFVARGDIFIVPKKEGATRDITCTSGIREKYVSYSPDGKWIAYISDKTGEDEIYLRPARGFGGEKRITFDGKCFRFPPRWSPDSKKLLFADKSLRLWYVDIEKKKPVLIDKAKQWEIRYYNWSPDSNWVVYSKAEENGFSSIFLYHLPEKKIYRVTSQFTDDFAPVFDPDGKYLYFLTNRSYNATLGTFDMSYVYNRTTRICLMTVRADIPSPFAPKDEMIEAKKEKPKEEKKPAKGKKEKAKKKKEEFRIDLEGMENRTVVIPIKPGNISNLSAVKGKILYITLPTRGLSGPSSPEKPALHLYDIKAKKDFTLLSPIANYDISPDGKKLIYRSGKTYGIVDIAGRRYKVGDGALNLSGMKMKVDLRAEWRQMFAEAWRLERDYFYSPKMNGVDWKKMKKKYEVLLPYVAHRFDLIYLLGEMVGELCNSHTYVGGGDMPKVEHVNVGMLGVDFELDKASGRYRFKKIYRGDNSRERYRAPLAEPGIKVKEGDYLLAVEGKELSAPTNPYALFENTVGKPVVLTVNSKPTMKGAWNITVKPIANEFNLRYLAWVEGNRKKVEKMSHGLIGYIYLPDMSADGLNEFVRQFYPQVRKKGLIIDVRYNGGGFVDQLILERLRRILIGMDMSRNGADSTIPSVVFHGHMLTICNAYSASDGDIFPFFFKKYKLGPVIGTRTWGGVRGIRGYTPLLDGGYVTMPEFSVYGLDSKWVMENHGVDPDIVVDNRPDLVVKGRDPQLEMAVKILLEKIKKEPKKLPKRPPYLPPYPEFK
ncbi:MAG: PD40 domain-containing protein [Acidobacteria bacterium]|nr:PD40 domain-containing protein [Acidobacteriota bacterium]